MRPGPLKSAADEVRVEFELTEPFRWRSQATCSHGTASTMTQTAPGVLDHVRWVENIWRQHQLVVGCDCPYTPYGLNATVTYTQSPGVQPGEQRIILEQSATIEPPGNNFVFHGRLTCRRAGAYYVDAKLQPGASIASGASGLLQVFVAGTPPMLSGPMIDEAGKATAIVTGMMNLFPNQPLAVAYLNTGTSNRTSP